MVCNAVRKCCSTPCELYMWCKECRVEADDSNITCQERNKRYNLYNPDKLYVVKYHMDGGIIRDEQNKPKCDYLLYVKDEHKPTVYFVELKGRDVHHALEQVQASLTEFAKDFLGHRLLVRIVCKSVPRIANNPKDIKIQKEIKQRYNAELMIRENNYNEKYK